MEDMVEYGDVREPNHSVDWQNVGFTPYPGESVISTASLQESPHIVAFNSCTAFRVRLVSNLIYGLHSKWPYPVYLYQRHRGLD